MSEFRWGRAIAGTASALVLGLTVVSATAGQLLGNVTSIDISNQVGDRDTDFGDLTSGPLDILLMGSDTREGAGNGGFGKFEGARSDTTMLLHIFGDRSQALVVSIPRDTWVTIPECISSRTGNPVSAHSERFNAAFDIGGPGCTLKTVEALGSVQVEHFGVLDFGGFKRTIDAMGGVPICLEKPVSDPASKLDLPAGVTQLDGKQALAFVRARKTLGDGSDISRIGRQQIFLSAMIQQVTDSGLLTDPVRLYKVASEATKSLATDPALADIDAILALVGSLTGIKPSKIAFTTLPWLPRSDGATVEMDTVRAAPIWSAIRDDAPWPPPVTPGADGNPLVKEPKEITVKVASTPENVTQIGPLVQGLMASGFQASNAGGILTAAPAVTTIHFHPDFDESARTLQAAIPGSVLKPDTTARGALVVDLGTDSPAAVLIKVLPPKTGSGGGIQTADEKVCV